MSQLVENNPVHQNPAINWKNKDWKAIERMYSGKSAATTGNNTNPASTKTVPVSSIHDLTIEQYEEIFPDLAT